MFKEVAMPEQENIDLVRRAYESFQAGNIAGVLSAFSENVEWSIPHAEGLAFSGARRGRDQVRQFFESMTAAQQPRQFEPREFIASGDRVVVLGHYAWHVVSTGRDWESDWAHVYTIRDGQIVRFQEYTDTAVAVAAHQNR
jgi:ketosteroid isomerase-like protein